MANSPFFAELVKLSVFKKLWAPITVDYLRDSKMRNQCCCGINYLFSVTGFSGVMQVRVSAELACGNQVIIPLFLSNVHVEVLKRVLAWFVCEDQFCLVRIFVCFTRET